MATDYTLLTGPKSTPGSIKWLVNYEKVDPATALEDAQAYIYGSLRVREMKKSAPVVIAQGASTATLPADFLDPIIFHIPALGSELGNRPETDLERESLWDEDGNRGESVPSIYAVFDEALNFDCKAQEAYTGRLVYYHRPAPLSGANLSNFLCTRYPTILRAACQMFAADQGHDTENYAIWKDRTDSLISRAAVETDLVLRGAEYAVRVR